MYTHCSCACMLLLYTQYGDRRQTLAALTQISSGTLVVSHCSERMFVAIMYMLTLEVGYCSERMFVVQASGCCFVCLFLLQVRRMSGVLMFLHVWGV